MHLGPETGEAAAESRECEQSWISAVRSAGVPVAWEVIGTRQKLMIEARTMARAIRFGFIGPP
jgi:hypothetical protein